MAQNFGCLFIILKLLIFRLIITYFGTLRMHRAPFLSKKKIRGSMSPDPPSKSLNQHHNRANNAPGI